MISVVIGLLVLSIVVFIHELGHFIAAKLSGVEVESFSIGWGPVLFKKKRGTTEYRLSAIPIGGYCGMKGEQAFKQAIENKEAAIPYEEKSFYSVHPFKRVIIAFAGPFANLLLTVVALAFTSALGSTYYTADNRIVPAYLFDDTDNSPAKEAQLQLGDRIVQINEEPVHTFADIQRCVTVHPDETLTLTLERNGQRIIEYIRPALNKKNGTGQIGIYYYIPLDVAAVKKDSAAALAGIQPEDHIAAINGQPIEHLVALHHFFQDYTEKTALFQVIRNNTPLQITVPLVRTEHHTVDLGIDWKVLTVTEAGTGFFQSIYKGIVRTGNLIYLTLKSFTLLFKGIPLTEAVAGPVRISVMIGNIAKASFQDSIKEGFSNLAEFVAVICVSLFLMNVLPIPVLDGGLIFFACIEWISCKKIPPRVLYYVQFIGIAFIALLFMIALWTDVLFILR